MMKVRRSNERGHAAHGWLDTYHTFSFADYHDPRWMGYRSLRVINDDLVMPGMGFGKHPHRDMEIITYVREGAITHEDSMGNKGRTEAGDVQVMSAGTGIRHSEYNLEDKLTKIFQIWIMPNRTGQAPSWGAMTFPKGEHSGKFVTLASGLPGDAGVLPLRADARVVGATVKAGETLTYPIDPQRHAYLVSTTGSVEVNGVTLAPRDGAAITGEAEVKVTALGEDAEVVLVDAI